MHTPANQDNVDDKINRFITRKSPSLWKTFSEAVTRKTASTADSHDVDNSDITYEQLDWHRTSVVANSRLQKAH